MSNKNFNYTIVNYDPATKALDVDFGDEGWARISLRTPLPKNRVELEEIIATFAPTVEHIEARTNADVSLEYIEHMVGKPYSAKRHAINKEDDAPLIVSQVIEEDVSPVDDYEIAFLKQLIDERLKLHKVIK